MRKGFTLIELLAVIVILAVIALIATPIILGIISDAKKSAFKDAAYGIADAAKNEYVKEMYSSQTSTDIIFVYTNNEESSNVTGKSLVYSGSKPNNGAVSLTKTGTVAIAIYDGTYCAYKSYSDREVTVEKKTWTECEAILNSLIAINSDYDTAKGVNKPKLATGMTPIKRDGTVWVDTTESDNDWYNYTAIDKKWANARTEDGSMWVWIPRYAYQIASGYHTGTVGTINVKFLKNNTNTASDDSTVDTVPTYSDVDTQSNYIVHPAFKFDGTELTGIWVAKFEMSGTTASLDSKPGIQSLRNITLGNMFTATRSMETNDKYGWVLASGLNADGTFTTDTNNVDTHVMKNSEWGAMAYFSQSMYGKNAEITTNSTDYYTGGGTGNAYVTNVGQSSTGNIYGIYDMSGGANERVMGNYNNIVASSDLTPSSINDKYIDRYPTTSSGYTASIYGDAVYETSSNTGGNYSWYGDYSSIPNTDNPWFVRGGGPYDGSGSGSFDFGRTFGAAFTGFSWRSVVFVGTGL